MPPSRARASPLVGVMNSTANHTKGHLRGVREAAAALALVALSAMTSACLVGSVPPPSYADGYEPVYYDGNLVYYDDAGRPFYYDGGGVVWVRPSAPAYPTLMAHWRSRPSAYRAWYAHQGYRYRGRGYRSRRR